MAKRRPPIAKTLIRNSKAAMFSAIEIHNKPIFKYRYEIVVILFINSWELLLKAFIYRFLKSVRLFDKKGESKPFRECLNCVVSNLDKSHLAVKENLDNLYKYRNEIAHFHIEDLNIIIFSLLRKSIGMYKKFLEQHFSIDITMESDLILLPMGFKKPYSPLDFLSNESAIVNSSVFVKNFVSDLIESTVRLTEVGVDEAILVEFDMNLTNEKRINNADIIAGISSSKDTGINIILDKIVKRPIPTDDSKATLVKSMSYTVTPETDLQEIASWIALKGKDPNFKPSENELWRLYSKREYLKIEGKQLLELVRFCLKQKIPVFYWINDIKDTELKTIFKNTFFEVQDFLTKSNILHVCGFLGNSFYTKILSKFTNSEFERLDTNSKKFPSSGPRQFFQETVIEYKKKSLKIRDEEKFKKIINQELNEISARLSNSNGGAYDKYHAMSFDCFLYAKDNLYR